MYLKVNDIEKAYDGHPILQPLSFGVPKGKVLSVLGRSGSGKTTLLKIIAGLETPDAGTIYLEDQEITNWSPQKRGIVYLYQEPLLFPHLSVQENIGFGLTVRKVAPNIKNDLVNEMMDHLGLIEHRSKMPDHLSGGQKQRVAFGRALIISPKVMLLDEPFAALDNQTRMQMQVMFKRMATRHNITALFVTHDIKEAIIMGEELACIRDGHWQLYHSIKSFLQDPLTCVQDEINFWKKLDP